MTDRFVRELLDGGSALRTIIGCIGDAVSIQDTKWKVVFQNDAHKKLYGDHIGDCCYRGFHRRKTVCEDCPVLMAFEDGGVHSLVKSCTTDTGVVYTETTASPIRDTEGRIVAGIKVARNITDRLKAEETVSGAKLLLEDVTQGITESILLLSTNFKVLWANKAALQQTGLGATELVGNHCYKATHGRDCHCEPPSNPCPVHELLRTGEPVAAEHEHHDKDGNTVYVEVSAYPIKDSRGSINRFVHISKDITERKNLEKERERLIEELQDALAEIRTLKGIIPICSSCKNIRNDRGYWQQMEDYISQNSQAKFTHGICPECAKKLYPDYLDNQE